MDDRLQPAGTFDTRTIELSYADRDGIELAARVHLPIDRAGDPAGRPGFVDVHGGAWRYFDRTVDDYHGRALASAGAVVAQIDFRQAPDHQWPTAVADVTTAVRWLKQNPDLGVDPDAVQLVGGSSGGHLALWSALRHDREECADPSADGVSDADASVRGILALWPIAAPDERYRYLSARAEAQDSESDEPLFDLGRLVRAQERFFGPIATMEKASVPALLAGGDHGRPPPLWVAHPEFDENVTLDMSERLVAAWQAAGGRADLHVFDGTGHGFVNFGGPDADRCVDAMIAEANRNLAQSEVPAS